MITNTERRPLALRSLILAHSARCRTLHSATVLSLAAGILSGCNVDVQEQVSTTPRHMIRQVTEDGWPKGDVAWSPDGEQIAYVRFQTTSALMAISANDGNSREMGRIEDNVDMQDFAVSPDGQRIVYLSRRKGDLWLVNPGDSDQRVLALADLEPHEPAWSPGGDRIAFSAVVAESEQSAIWVVDTVIDAVPVQVSPAREGLSFSGPSWSPDGTAIVCESDSNEICIIDVANQDLFVLVSDTTDSTIYRSPAWAPSAEIIACSVTRNGIQGIELVPVAGGEPRNVTPQFRGATNPAWSPDGSQLAFNSRSSVWVISIDGTYLQQTSLSSPEPKWWPHNNALITIEQTSTSTIDVSSLDGSSPVFSPNPGDARDVAPAWYPDSKRFVFVRRDDSLEVAQIRQIEPASGEESVLLDTGLYPDRFACSDCIANPAISPVDNTIVFDDTRDIFLLMPDGQLLNLSDDIAPGLRQPSWSYDGKQIACVSGGRLIIYDFRANALLERRSISGSFGHSSWSRPHPVFGSNIAVENGGRIFLLNPEGGEPEFILQGRNPSWSPDGTRLSLIQGNDVYIMEVFMEGG